MEFTNVAIVNINNVPVTNQGKQVYEAILKTGARSTEELMEHLDMTDGVIDLMLAHLYRYDLIKIEYKYKLPFRDEFLRRG